MSSVDAQGAERFNVYGPVKSVRPLKGPPASDCVRMCSCGRAAGRPGGRAGVWTHADACGCTCYGRFSVCQRAYHRRCAAITTTGTCGTRLPMDRTCGTAPGAVRSRHWPVLTSAQWPAAKLALRLALVTWDGRCSVGRLRGTWLAWQLISFHYVEAAEVRLLDDLINRPELYR